MKFRRSGTQSRLIRTLGILLWGALSVACDSRVQPAGSGPDSRIWRVDHHMHLASPDICQRVGECLETHSPPAVFAADAVNALDEAAVERGVVFSSAYLYGLPALELEAGAVARYMRIENEFTATEVARYPGRLAGFLSVDPLEPAAVEEIAYWRGSNDLVGLKLHLTASGVDLHRDQDLAQLNKVIRAAADQQLPIVVHIGGGDFDAADAELFIEKVMPSAGKSPVQVAHAGGGYPVVAGRHAAILRVFADHIVRNDPRTAQVLFDLSYVPAPEEDAESIAAIRREIRRIGMNRFLFGSDYNVQTPLGQIDLLNRLGLNADDLAVLQKNVAPWACMPGAAGCR